MAGPGGREQPRDTQGRWKHAPQTIAEDAPTHPIKLGDEQDDQPAAQDSRAPAMLRTVGRYAWAATKAIGRGAWWATRKLAIVVFLVVAWPPMFVLALMTSGKQMRELEEYSQKKRIWAQNPMLQPVICVDEQKAISGLWHLTEVAERENITVKVEPISEMPVAEGMSHYNTRVLRVAKGLDTGKQVSVFAHELAHFSDPTVGPLKPREGYFNVPAKEIVAEVSSYLFCQEFGVDSSDRCHRYVHNWLDETDKTMREVNKNGILSRRVAVVLSKLLPPPTDMAQLQQRAENTLQMFGKGPRL